MKAEIISVGTELLLGHTVNTDAAFIARELAALGIDLMNVETVGDNPGRLREVLETALSRSDLVITSGGLGPTLDDLTKKTIADTLGLPLVEDQDSLARLKEYFGTRPMRDNQLVQALLPKGATALKNTVGTAPGCFVAAGKEKFVMMLPGPPRELNPMFLNEAVPLLEKHTGAAFATYMLRTFNQSEGDAALKLGDLCTQANPTVATYLGAHNEMFVRVTAKGKDKASARKLALPVVEKVKNLLGDVIYGVNVESLEEVVVHELAERHEEVATAESCTGGLLAKRIKSDLFVISTAVSNVAIHFGTPEQENISRMTVAEAMACVEAGHFAPGSMLPKVLAAVDFVRATGKEAIITSPENVRAAVVEGKGTHIVP